MVPRGAVGAQTRSSSQPSRSPETGWKSSASLARGRDTASSPLGTARRLDACDELRLARREIRDTEDVGVGAELLDHLDVGGDAVAREVESLGADPDHHVGVPQAAAA